MAGLLASWLAGVLVFLLRACGISSVILVKSMISLRSLQSRSSERYVDGP